MRETVASPDSGSNYHLSEDDFNETRTKKSLFICFIRRRFYIFIFLVVSAVVWLFIYYKVLDHRFELPGPLRELQRYFGDGKAKPRRRPAPGDDSPNRFQFYASKSKKIPRKLPWIHVGVTACKKREDDALLSLNMLVMASKHCLHFHIFAERPQIFEQEISKWNGWTDGWLQFETYNVHYPWNETKQIWKAITDDKPCENQLLFVPNTLTQVNELIYIRTGVLFLRPPEDLWRLFRKFNSTQIFGMTNGTNEERDHHSRRSLLPYIQPPSIGVILMNLTRIRTYNWKRHMIRLYQSKVLDSALGKIDDLVVAMCAEQPEILYRLPCSWDYGPDNCHHGNNCLDAKRHGVAAIERSRCKWRKHSKDSLFEEVYEAVEDFRPSSNFSSDILARIDTKFRKHLRSGCGQMANQFLKHLNMLDV